MRIPRQRGCRFCSFSGTHDHSRPPRCVAVGAARVAVAEPADAASVLAGQRTEPSAAHSRLRLETCLSDLDGLAAELAAIRVRAHALSRRTQIAAGVERSQGEDWGRSSCGGCGRRAGFYCHVCLVPVGVPAAVTVPRLMLPCTVWAYYRDHPKKATSFHARVLAPDCVRLVEANCLLGRRYGLPDDGGPGAAGGPEGGKFDPATAAVLFPSDRSVPIAEYAPARKLEHLVVVDTTWTNTATVLDHPDIAHLPHLRLSAPPPDGQIWRPTKSPGRGQLSTVEAVRLAMQELSRAIRQPHHQPHGQDHSQFHWEPDSDPDGKPDGEHPSPNPDTDFLFDDLLFFFRRIRDKIDTDYAKRDCGGDEALSAHGHGHGHGPRPFDLGFKQARARLGRLQRDQQREQLQQRQEAPNVVYKAAQEGGDMLPDCVGKGVAAAKMQRAE